MVCILVLMHGQQVGLMILSRLGRLSASAKTSTSYRLDESRDYHENNHSPKTIRLLQFRELQKSRQIPGSPWYMARS